MTQSGRGREKKKIKKKTGRREKKKSKKRTKKGKHEAIKLCYWCEMLGLWGLPKTPSSKLVQNSTRTLKESRLKIYSK